MTVSPGDGPDSTTDAGEGPASVRGRTDARTTFRGPASATLVLEAIALPLVLPVISTLEGGITPLSLTVVVVLTVGMLVAPAVILKPWGLAFAVGLQVATLASWVVSPALGVAGLIYCVLWAALLWMRHEVIRRQAAWSRPD